MDQNGRQTSERDVEDSVEALTEELGELTLPTVELPTQSPDHPSSGLERSDSPSTLQTDPERSDRLFADSNAADTAEKCLFDPTDYPEKERLELLENFLKRWAPSKTKRSDGFGKIIVRSASFVDEGLGDIDGLKADWEKLKLSKNNINFSDIRELAVSHSCLSGMWLLYYDTGGKVDEKWEAIAKATVKDELGTHARVSPFEDTSEGQDLYNNQHAVSVCTKDFTNKKDVSGIEDKLRKLNNKCRMSYKPYVYTKIGVYSHNPWGLRPGIYTSHWDPVKMVSSIRYNEK